MNIPGLANKSVLDMSFGQRAVSRLASINADLSGRDDLNDVSKDLLSDCFPNLFYGDLPLKEVEGREINKTIFQYADEHLSKARESCHGKLVSSMFTAPLLGTALLDDKFIEDCLKKQDEANKAQEEAQKAEEQAQKSGDPGDQQQAQQARQKAKAAQDKLSEVSQKMSSQMSQVAIKSAVRRAAEGAEQVQDILSGWGDEEPTFDVSDTDRIKSFIDNLNSDKMKKISNLLGKFRGVALAARRAKTITGIKPTGVELTQDFDRIFAEEAAQLFMGSHEEMLLKWLDYFDIGLMGWEKKATLSEYGDFMVYVDKSGSMTHESNVEGQMYSNEVIATAISIAVAQATKSKERKWTLTTFSANQSSMKSITSGAGIEKLMKWAAFNPSGGTNFNMVIDDMVKNISNNADVLVITDCLFQVDDGRFKSIMDAKKDHNLRLMVITIGAGDTSSVEGLTDMVIDVNDLSDASILSKKIAQWVR